MSTAYLVKGVCQINKYALGEVPILGQFEFLLVMPEPFLNVLFSQNRNLDPPIAGTVFTEL
jgi:hypothetical protein